MNLIINGQPRQLEPGASVDQLLAALGMERERVAVELNRDIVPRERFATTELHDGDALEIVQFVGGG